MTQLLDTVRPDAVAIETLFYTTNQKTVIAVAEARGVILCAKLARVPIFRVYAAAGETECVGLRPRVQKQVQEMTRILRLPEVPRTRRYGVDALAMAICHGYSFRSQQYGIA